jgi:hypothetical protein
VLVLCAVVLATLVPGAAHASGVAADFFMMLSMPLFILSAVSACFSRIWAFTLLVLLGGPAMVITVTTLKQLAALPYSESGDYQRLLAAVLAYWFAVLWRLRHGVTAFMATVRIRLRKRKGPK